MSGALFWPFGEVHVTEPRHRAFKARKSLLVVQPKDVMWKEKRRERGGREGDEEGRNGEMRESSATSFLKL